MLSKKPSLFVLMLLIISIQLSAQLNLTPVSKINTKCDGFGCEYFGPSILINEVMIKPSSGNGSIFGNGQGASGQAGEWIELYNPDLCKSIDISCYFLGNNAPDQIGSTNGNYGGGFELPAGTIVPPRGFCIVRGVNAPAVPAALLVQNGGSTVEVIVSNNNSVCIGGGLRLWFPDSGGWFAFYNRFGVPQDAISWNNNNSGPNSPCNPAGNCPFTGTLPSYDLIPAIRKTYIYNNQPPTGQSIRRLPDGGNWAINSGGTGTYGTCNAACAPTPLITCNGKAYVGVTGGVPPYTYLWDDGQGQTNDTAMGLCDGTYCVTVQDANGLAGTACVIVQDYKPAVSAIASLPAMCQFEAPVLLTSGSPAGGTYSGTGVSGNSFNPTIAGAGTHIITYTWANADSCRNSAITTVLVYSAPTVTLGAIPSLCINSPATALTQGFPPGGTYTGTGVSGNSFSPALTGQGTFTITYHYSSPGGCTDSATNTITVNVDPSVVFAPLTGVCLDAPAYTLTGGSPAGGTYSGQDVSSGKFFAASAGVGVHTITYYYVDANNCAGSAIQTIEVYALPFVSLAPIPDICNNAPAFALSGGSPAGGTYSGSVVSGGMFDPQLVGSGLFTITYTVTDVHGCRNDSAQRFHVLALPTVTLSPFPDVCIDALPITLSNGSPAGGTYSGSGVSGGIFSPLVAGPGDITIHYVYEDAIGCGNDTTAVIKVNPLPQTFVVSGGGYYCQGADFLTVSLDGSEPGIEYLLSVDGHALNPAEAGTGSPLDFAALQDSGVYTIHATNILTGCNAQMSGFATIYRIYMPSVELGDTLYICNAAGMILDAGDFKDTLIYQWNDGSSERFFTVTTTGMILVKVIKGQCYSADSVQVEDCNELSVGNVFTPNGDAQNERFLPEITAGDILKYSIDIFNRWGKMVYQSENVKEGWDGTLFNKGSDCAEGVYFYIIKYLPDQSFPSPSVERKLSGQVTLMR